MHVLPETMRMTHNLTQLSLSHSSQALLVAWGMLGLDLLV